MPTHLLLEGPDIESVLGRLREDHGPDAKIVQAELVRSGGFGGFFAKRRYEVTVEVDDDQPAGADLVAESAGEMATGEIAAAEPADALAPAAAASSGFTPYGIDALLSAAERMDQAEVGGRTVVAAAAPTPTTVPVQAPAAPATGWHRPVSTEGTAFSDVLGALTHDLAAPVAEPSAADLPTPRAPLDAPTEPKPEPEPEFEQQPVFESTVAGTVAVERIRQQLAELGVPDRLLAQVTDADPVLAVRDVTRDLPVPTVPACRPSATRGGAIVAVVGSWAMARATVRGLAAELGTDPSAVIAVATPTGSDLPEGSTVRSYGAAVGLVRQARHDHDVTILVIDPGPTRHSAARAAQALLTLEPQSVLVAGDAGSDLRVTLLALDALEQAEVPVDGLALVGVSRSLRPAAALEVPVPVSWLDGRLATTGSWVGTLLDALVERRPGVGAHRISPTATATDDRSARSARSARC